MAQLSKPKQLLDKHSAERKHPPSFLITANGELFMLLYYKRAEGHQSLWIQQIMSYARYYILKKFENHREHKSGSWKLTRFSCYQYLHVFFTPFTWVFRFSVCLKFHPKLHTTYCCIT